MAEALRETHNGVTVESGGTLGPGQYKVTRPGASPEWTDRPPFVPQPPKPAPKATPAVQAQQPVNGGVCNCPYAAQKPCDVQSLEVAVTFVDLPADGALKGVPVTRKIKVDKKRRAEPATEHGFLIRRKLKEYDFVIDAIADFPQPPETDAKTFWETMKQVVDPKTQHKFVKNRAAIEAEAEFYGLFCDPKIHGKLEMKPMSGGPVPPVGGGPMPPMTSVKVNTKANKLATQEFGSTRFAILDNTYAEVDALGQLKDAADTGAMFLFEWLASLIGIVCPREIEVVAHSCGIRPKEEPLPLNHDLRGLVRVFRKDVWSVGVKIPPLGKFTDKEEAMRDVRGGGSTYERERSNLFRGQGSSTGESTRISSSTTTTTTTRGHTYGDGEMILDSKKTSTYGNALRTETSRQYTSTTGSSTATVVRGIPGKAVPYRQTTKGITEKLEKSPKFELFIARNGIELGSSGPLEIIKKIIGAITTLAKTISTIRELFKKMPQVGWKFSLDLSILEGTVAIELAPKPQKAVSADGRHWAVKYEVEVQFELTLIELKMSLSFGIELTAAGTGFVAKIEGSVSIKVGLGWKGFLDIGKAEPVKIQMPFSTKTELKIVAAVTLAGKVLAGAELSVSNGFEFKYGKEDGYCEIGGPKGKFQVIGDLNVKPTVLNGYLKIPWWFDKKVDNYVLLAGCTLQKFG